ncbi:thioredoxin [Deinococcus sp. UYEF24]
MTEFVMLTQDACSECERLKQMLARPLKGKYDALIEVVHRAAQPEEFAAQVERYHLSKTPVLIHPASGSVLTQTASLGEVSAFLNSHLAQPV